MENKFLNRPQAGKPLKPATALRQQYRNKFKSLVEDLIQYYEAWDAKLNFTPDKDSLLERFMEKIGYGSNYSNLNRHKTQLSIREGRVNSTQREMFGLLHDAFWDKQEVALLNMAHEICANPDILVDYGAKPNNKHVKDIQDFMSKLVDPTINRGSTDHSLNSYYYNSKASNHMLEALNFPSTFFNRQWFYFCKDAKPKTYPIFKEDEFERIGTAESRWEIASLETKEQIKLFQSAAEIYWKIQVEQFSDKNGKLNMENIADLKDQALEFLVAEDNMLYMTILNTYAKTKFVAHKEEDKPRAKQIREEGRENLAELQTANLRHHEYEGITKIFDAYMEYEKQNEQTATQQPQPTQPKEQTKQEPKQQPAKNHKGLSNNFDLTK